MTPNEMRLANKQYRRGFSDAQAGHSPSRLRGPYIDGYAHGRSVPKGIGKVVIGPYPEQDVADLTEELADCREAHEMTLRREKRIKAERDALREEVAKLREQLVPRAVE